MPTQWTRSAALILIAGFSGCAAPTQLAQEPAANPAPTSSTAEISSQPYSSGETLAEPFSNRGAVYLGKGQFDLAIADFNEAIRLNPNYAPAYSNRAAAYFFKGQTDAAIADLDQAIRLDPNLANAFANRGAAYASWRWSNRPRDRGFESGDPTGSQKRQILLQPRSCISSQGRTRSRHSRS